jgi:hypothetical protein
MTWNGYPPPGRDEDDSVEGWEEPDEDWRWTEDDDEPDGDAWKTDDGEWRIVGRIGPMEQMYRDMLEEDDEEED